MGQYYRPLLWKDKQIWMARSYDFNNGAKLLEHSWFGGYMVEGIMDCIKDNPKHIVWMGDYAGDGLNDEIFNVGSKEISAEEAMELTWGERENEPIRIKDLGDMKTAGFLVNHSKGEYVNLQDFYNRCYDKTWKDCVHPLPLLTAIGNEAGGGDYFGPERENVGMWAYDEIEYMDKAPETSYVEIKPTFVDKDCH